jgi:hypothetical protein
VTWDGLLRHDGVRVERTPQRSPRSFPYWFIVGPKGQRVIFCPCCGNQFGSAEVAQVVADAMFDVRTPP